MTMKQSKQPRPGTGQVLRTMRPEPETRPSKPPAADGPDAARSAPHATAGGSRVKGDTDSAGYAPRAAQEEGHPSKEAFQATENAAVSSESSAAYRDQEPRSAGSAGNDGEGTGSGEQGGEQQYVRLRVRVRGDQLSVVDSQLVDGPLGQVTGFAGSNAYEVTLDGRMLHAGPLPDLGVQRSFPNPEGPQLQQGHFVTERDVFEFTARVPAEALTRETIGRVRLTLHRLTEAAHAPRLGDEPLASQFEREVRPIGELEGLPESALPAAIEERGDRAPSV
jgi:hypothetical protein